MLINCHEKTERREGQACLRCQPSVSEHPDNNTNPTSSYNNIANSQLEYFMANISNVEEEPASLLAFGFDFEI